MTLEFNPLKNMCTQVNLTHTKFIDEESKNNHMGGWTGILTVLETILNKK